MAPLRKEMQREHAGVRKTLWQPLQRLVSREQPGDRRQELKDPGAWQGQGAVKGQVSPLGLVFSSHPPCCLHNCSSLSKL